MSTSIVILIQFMSCVFKSIVILDVSSINKYLSLYNSNHVVEYLIERDCVINAKSSSRTANLHSSSQPIMLLS